ncbi:MAG: hypothetical protein JNM18_16420 [Planctomycetaceae bacterium]|nr:hypothetical protein [Planctomycetaceae bacterium]
MTSARWFSFLDDRYAQIIVGVAVIAVLIAIGVYVVGKLRTAFNEQPQNTSDVMSTFRELHEGGELSDEEYKSIKAKLSASLKQQMTRPKPKSDDS